MTEHAPAPTPEPTPAPAPVQTPEGFVPVGELEKVEAQRKGFQSENDRLKSELAALQAKQPPAAPTPAPGDKGFDPDAFRAQLLKDVHGATALTNAATSLKSEFPYADAGLFSAESLTKFASPEALRIAVEADHNRVKALVDAQVAAKEEELKKQLGAQVGSQGGPVAPPTPGVDPTVQQLNAMSPAELDAFDKANPGVVQRVMAAAMAATG